MESFSNNRNLKELIQMKSNVIMYGSEKTVRIFAIFQRETFKLGQKEEKEKTNASFVNLALLAELIASIKYDFTGYNITSEDILRVNITDLHEKNNMEIFMDAVKSARELISESNDSFLELK